MIHFTLTLNDYLDQYVINKHAGENVCPICYESELTWNRNKDIEHIMDCYKQQILLKLMRKYHERFNVFPEITDDFMDYVFDQMREEMVTYCGKHQI